jgi:alanine racemase
MHLLKLILYSTYIIKNIILLYMIIINSKQLLKNIQTIFDIKKDDSKVCISLKMDAYGFGIENVISLCEKFRVYAYGVTENDEIKQIRKYTIKPILRLRPVLYSEIIEVLDYDVQEMIGSLDDLSNIININNKFRKNIPIWINLDSNLGRDGFILNKNQIQELVQKLLDYKINIVGIRTHHNETSDNVDQIMNEFYEKALILKKSFPNAIIHGACSYLFLTREFQQKYNYDMIAIGSAIFSRTARSLYSSKIISNQKPTYMFLFNILQVRKVPSNTKIGYGGSYITEKEEYIATINMGWFNGPNFIYCISNQNDQVRINKKIYKILAYSANEVNILVDENIKVGDKVYYNTKPDYFNDILNLKNNKKIVY